MTSDRAAYCIARICIIVDGQRYLQRLGFTFLLDCPDHRSCWQRAFMLSLPWNTLRDCIFARVLKPFFQEESLRHFIRCWRTDKGTCRSCDSMLSYRNAFLKSDVQRDVALSMFKSSIDAHWRPSDLRRDDTVWPSHAHSFLGQISFGRLMTTRNCDFNQTNRGRSIAPMCALL